MSLTSTSSDSEQVSLEDFLESCRAPTLLAEMDDDEEMGKWNVKIRFWLTSLHHQPNKNCVLWSLLSDLAVYYYIVGNTVPADTTYTLSFKMFKHGSKFVIPTSPSYQINSKTLLK